MDTYNQEQGDIVRIKVEQPVEVEIPTEVETPEEPIKE